MGDMRTTAHSSLTPEQRSQRARLAATSRWAAQDGRAGTEAARAKFLARFEQEVDPAGELPEAERTRRAEAARRAHFQRLAWQRHHGTKAS